MEANDYMVYRNHLAINREWLDKLGLEVPETTDELYRVLQAFKERDPNGNGKRDEIPLASLYGGINQNFHALFNAFGVRNPDGNKLAVKDNHVRYEPVQPEYKEAVKYIHKLYAEQLIDPETFTQDAKRFMAKGGAPEIVYGAFTAFLGNVELGSLERLKRYAFVPPLTGPNGDRTWRRQDNRITPNTFSITSANKYPEATMRLIDAMNEEDTAFQLWRGPYGSHIRKEADGKIRQNPLPARETVLEAWIGEAAPYNSVPLYFTKSMMDNYVLDETSGMRNEAYKLYKPYIVPEEETYPQYLYYTVEQLQQLKVLDVDIQSYQSEMEAKWIVEGGIDEEWERYIAELHKMGLADKIRIHQDAYDAYRQF
jgi:putative aldouronate transport system substrate-binding protein